MRIQVDEIASVIKQQIDQYRSEVDVSEVGRVLEVGDGIARIYGLSEAMAGELLEFEDGQLGQVFNLESDSIGAVIYGDFLSIKEGDQVKSVGRLLSVPVGEQLLGRVVDPLGRPLDGGEPINTSEYRPSEAIAVGIAERQPVNQPMQTGIKAIDSMIPIGRGQRELIIGDRKTGKTAIAIDAIINQKQYQGTDQAVICVYVAIGQKESTVASLVDTLRQHGAMDYTTVVSAGSSDAAPLQFVAPYAGCAMAEHFMYQGKHTLVIYDDLSKQATAYRQLSLLLRRPPGREAFPGDVFYLHSRLLERAVKLADRRIIVKSDASADTRDGVDGKVYMGEQDKEACNEKAKELGGGHEIRTLPDSGGSLTALPIIETQEGEVSAYIPTNVISITDGQIYLQPDLFFAGVRPAVDVGLSVSRVGNNALTKGMKSVASSLRLDLAAFRDLEAFAQLGTELDAATQAQLDRGYRMVEILKQPQYRPVPVADQIMVLYAGVNGFLDKVPIKNVLDWEQKFLSHVSTAHKSLRDTLVANPELTDEISSQLKKVIEDFNAGFQSA